MHLHFPTRTQGTHTRNLYKSGIYTTSNQQPATSNQQPVTSMRAYHTKKRRAVCAEGSFYAFKISLLKKGLLELFFYAEHSLPYSSRSLPLYAHKRKKVRIGKAFFFLQNLFFLPEWIRSARKTKNASFCLHGGKGIRTHGTTILYVDLANQCLQPLSHSST